MSAFHRVWQRVLIAMARNHQIRGLVENYAGASELARRFVGGADLSAAVSTARRLSEEGIATSLYVLGEYETEPAVIDSCVAEICAAAKSMAEAGVGVHVSVDPTQIGYLNSPALLARNAERIAAAVRQADAGGVVMLDMEDARTVDMTLALHRRLLRDGPGTGVTLQADLKRTRNDLEHLLDRPCAVRLVKGAFAPGSDIGYTGRENVKRAYLALADVMLRNVKRAGGFRPVFATHDESILVWVVERAAEYGWSAADFELEMLYGVRSDLQRKFAAAGHSVRAYVPFGRHWWPYAARRVGEAPRNAGLIVRALLRGM